MRFLVAIFLVGIIIMFHEFGHFLAAKFFGIGVTEFSLGMGPMLVGKRLGDTVYSLRLFPVGGFCAMYGEPSMESSGQGEVSGKKSMFQKEWRSDQAFTSHPKWQQMLVALAGPFANMVMAFVAAVVLACMPGVDAGRGEVTVVGDGSVAEEVGILPGDVIMSVNGRDVPMSQGYSTYLATHPKTLGGYDLTVYRPSDDQEYRFHLVPNPDTGLVGVTYKAQSLSGAFAWADGGCRLLQNAVRMSFDFVGMLFRGDAKLSDMSGIIGITASIGDTVGEAAQMEQEDGGENKGAVLQAVLSLCLLLCVSLAVMNMLPLPALDGGRALLSLGEWVTGKKVPIRATEWINGVCMMALLLFMGVVMVMDLVKIFTAMA